MFIPFPAPSTILQFDRKVRFSVILTCQMFFPPLFSYKPGFPFRFHSIRVLCQYFVVSVCSLQNVLCRGAYRKLNSRTLTGNVQKLHILLFICIVFHLLRKSTRLLDCLILNFQHTRQKFWGKTFRLLCSRLHHACYRVHEEKPFKKRTYESVSDTVHQSITVTLVHKNWNIPTTPYTRLNPSVSGPVSRQVRTTRMTVGHRAVKSKNTATS